IAHGAPRDSRPGSAEPARPCPGTQPLSRRRLCRPRASRDTGADLRGRPVRMTAAVSLSRGGHTWAPGPALRHRLETALLLARGIGLLGLAMAIPIGQLVFGSFGLAGIGATGVFTLAHYVEVLTNPLLRSSLLFSLEIALATAALSTAASALFATLLMI